MNKDLISGFDLTKEDILEIFRLTRQLKKKRISTVLKNKVLGLIFQKPSVRTRVSFEIAAFELGAHCIYLAPQDIDLGVREPIKDVARVLSRYLGGIVARTFSHSHVLELARYADVSVINGLSDLYHPCQALADIYTIYEQRPSFREVKLVFIGDGNNVAHSLLAVGSKIGLNIAIATPPGYAPDKNIWNEAKKIAQKNKAAIIHTNDPKEALKNADYVYTDVWTSMGQEKERQKRLRDFKKYQINSALLKAIGGNEYRFMHCMPVHRGEEVTDEVMESKQSIVFEQSENRLHVQKAIMALMLK